MIQLCPRETAAADNGIPLAAILLLQLIVSELRLVCAAIAVAGMALLFGTTYVSAGQDPATASALRTIEVVAKRFAFEPARIEVSEGERVELVVRSADGVHGIQVKALNFNKVVPRGGKPVSIEFVAPTPGTYEILCSEYCGDGHESMVGTLVVVAKPRTR
ncbi:MAG: cupredoxin domain-containing protein [Acidobacteriota bacterium]